MSAVREMSRRAKAGETCIRCYRREAPPRDSEDFQKWHPLDDGPMVACPDCLTTEEKEQMDPKVRENRLRRMAQRQGLRLEKSRRRDPRALDYGTYQLTDPATNTLVAHGGQNGYGLDLDAIEKALTE